MRLQELWSWHGEGLLSTGLVRLVSNPLFKTPGSFHDVQSVRQWSSRSVFFGTYQSHSELHQFFSSENSGDFEEHIFEMWLLNRKHLKYINVYLDFNIFLLTVISVNIQKYKLSCWILLKTTKKFQHSKILNVFFN